MDCLNSCRGAFIIGAPLAIYIGTMKRSDSNKAYDSQPVIEVASVPDPDGCNWEKARAYTADCLIELLRGRVGDQSFHLKESTEK